MERSVGTLPPEVLSISSALLLAASSHAIKPHAQPLQLWICSTNNQGKSNENTLPNFLFSAPTSRQLKFGVNCRVSFRLVK